MLSVLLCHLTASLYKNVFLSLLCYYRIPSCEHSTALFSLLGIRLLVVEAVRNLLQNTILCASGIVWLGFRLCSWGKACTLVEAPPFWFSIGCINRFREQHFYSAQKAVTSVKAQERRGERRVSPVCCAKRRSPCAHSMDAVIFHYTKPQQPLTKHFSAGRDHGETLRKGKKSETWATSHGHSGWKAALGKCLRRGLAPWWCQH